MKRPLRTSFALVAFVLPLLATHVGAQNVFRMVTESAQRTVSNPMSGYTQTHLASFKLNALNYLAQQGAARLQHEELNPLLDTQAYYLSEFLTLYFREILKNRHHGADADKQRQRVALFMDASKSNPLFADNDTVRTDAYINAGNQLTPFCLNTDWKKAYYAAKLNL